MKAKFPQKLSQTPILLEKLTLQSGVSVIDPDSAWISPDINIGRGTTIYPNCYLIGEAGSVIGEGCEVGPNAFLRDRFQVGNRVKIGFNAEVVRSIIGDETKIPHSCHIGDANIGCNCNIAAGVEIGNYDGRQKHWTIIKDCVFVGIGVKIIAPVVIGAHAYIGAGAIISKDVEPYDLIIGVNKVVEGKKSYCRPKSHEASPDDVHVHQPQDGWRLYPIDEHPVWKAREG